MDKIKSLYESYIAEGVISPSTTLEQFTSANEEQQSTLYNQGIQANVLSQETGFDLFKSAWDLKKKEDTELPLPVGSLEQQEPVEVQEEIITAEQPEVVETTTIEKMAGSEPTSTFFGDIARAWKQGSAQAGSVDEAFELFFKGKDVDDEDVDDFIKAVQVMDEVPQTKAMESFYKTYEKEGADIYAFFAGLEGNLAVLPQLFISSARAMANPESIMAATGSAAVAGIASGGTLALPAAIAGLSGSLETALSFTEGLKKELGEKDFTRKNVREILEDPAALSRIRNKAIARGAVIGGVDAITLGLSSKLGVNAAKLAGKLGGKTTAKALAATTAAGAGEAIGGGTGEALAQVITGEKLDAANIMFETVTGAVGGPLAVGKALYSIPKYRIGNVNVTREKFIESIDKANAEEILTMEVGIKNDEEVSAIMNSKFKDATIEKSTKEVVPNISDESLSKIIKLTKRKEILEANGQEAAKVELPKVNKQIKDIIDAVQKPSTEKVDVSKQARDGEGVGVRDTIESTTEVTSEETDITKDQEITQEADVTEVVKEKDGVTTTNFEKIIKGRKRSNSLAPISVLDNYELDLEANNIEGMDIVGVREIRKKDGVTAATIMVREGDGQFEAEVVLQDKVKEGVDVTELTEKEKLEKVTKEKVKNLVTAPRRITEPFKINQTTVTLNEDGTIKSAVNSKGNPVSPEALKKVQKKVLENLIDIDSGEKATVVEGVDENNIDNYILENSSNIREIAFSIKSQKSKVKNKKQLIEEAKDATKLNDLEQSYFTMEDLAKYYDKKILKEKDVSPGTDLRTDRGPSRNIRRYWTIPAEDKFGRSSIGVSDFALTAEGLGITPGELVDIIVQFPTRNVMKPTSGTIVETSKPSTLIELQKKFKSLTGITPTASIVDFVIGIEQGRIPIDLLKTLEKEKLYQPTLNEKGEVVEGGAFGKKRGPSAKKITSTPKKEITIDEAKALTDQIKLEAKAAREAKLDIKKKRAKINEVIKGIKSKAQITATQAGVLTRKINSLNVDNETKVEEFLKYADKVIQNAELAEKIKRADGLRKTAKKNIKNKIGTAKDLFPALESLFNINIQAIPLDKIDSYLELAEAFGERKSVLTLPEKGLALQQAEDILNSIEDEAQVADDVEVKEDDYNLQEEIDNIVNNRIEVPSLIEPEKVLADYLNSLSKEDIEGLVTEKDGKKSYVQVEKLKNVLGNIENGYVPKAASDLVVNIKANRGNKIIAPVIGNLKFNVLEQGIEKTIAKAKAYLKSKSGVRATVGQQIRAVPLTNIDEALGNFNKKDIARETFDYLASEYSKYEVALGKIDNILSEAEALLTQGKMGRFSKRLLNQAIKAKYKIMAFQLQREYESNDGKKGTAPALDFINSTIDAIKSEEQNFLKDNDVKILEEIKEEFAIDKKIDNDKILKSLSSKEKKALELIDEANQSLAEKALFTSGVLRGNRVNLFSNYVHHDVIMKNDEDAEKVLDNKRKRMTKPSTKSKTLLERTPGAKPISFDPISSAGRAAKETLLDFHMTMPIRITNKTLANVIETIEADPNSTKLQRGTAKAVKDAFEEINSIIFDNTYQEVGVANNVLEKAKKLGYYAALASLPRAGAELGSNLSFALLSNPQGLTAGIKNFGKYSMSTQGAEVLDVIGSSQTLKLYNKEALTGKLADTNIYQRGKDKRGKAVNPVIEKIDYLYNNIPIAKSLIETNKVISEQLISTPDKAISRPLYFDTFVRSFAKATKKSGKEIKLTSEDFKNIDDYVAKYPNEIKEAREKADDENIRMATTVNPYSGILKLQPKKGDSTIDKIYKQANGYMARFTLFEYSTFRKAVRALYTDGEISKLQATGLLAGTTARMTSYMILYQFLSNMFDTVAGGVFDLDVEEEEDELENQLMRQLVGTGSTLILRRAVGNIPAIPISLGIELLNEQYGEDLRGGEEYDEFENSLVFSQIGLNELRKSPLEVLLTKSLLGPYTPLARSISRGVKVAQRLTGSAKEETKQKYMDELTGRMALEAAGNAGLLPFYKDIRRIFLKNMFKDKPKTSGKGSKYTEKDFKNAKNNPAKQRFIRQKINSQKNTNKKFSKRSIPGTKK